MIIRHTIRTTCLYLLILANQAQRITSRRHGLKTRTLTNTNDNTDSNIIYTASIEQRGDLHHQQGQLSDFQNEISIDPRELETAFGPAKTKFIEECTNYLLSPSIIADNKISQVDFTNFLLYICILNGKCSPNSTLEFESLSVFLQLKFVWAICPKSLPPNQYDQCVIDLDNQGEEYGLIITPDNFDEIATAVNKLCISTWASSTKYHGGTPAPTSLPTVSPSLSPSKQPSSAPSTLPSTSPSLSPTKYPSLHPSSSPSSTPTFSPTNLPSYSPSVTPPSPSPTTSFPPTNHPTKSISPTIYTPIPTDFNVVFTFLLGLDDDTIKATDVINDVDNLKQNSSFALISILKKMADKNNNRNLRRNARFLEMTLSQNSKPTYLDIWDAKCPSDSTSTNCIALGPNLVLQADAKIYDQERIGSELESIMKAAMTSDEFLNIMSSDKVKEVKWVGLGLVNIPPPTPDPTPDGNRSGGQTISVGVIAGIGAGAALLAASALFIFVRRRSKDNRDDDLDEKSKDSLVPRDIPQSFSRLGAVPLEESYASDLRSSQRDDSSIDSEILRAGSNYAMIQFDPENPAATLSPLRTGSSTTKSDDGSDDKTIPEGQQRKLDELNAALNAGDWEMVAELAAELDTNDELSSMESTTSSNKSDNPERSAKLDALIDKWSAAGATAEVMASNSSADGDVSSSGTSRDDRSSSNDSVKAYFSTFLAKENEDAVQSQTNDGIDDNTQPKGDTANAKSSKRSWISNLPFRKKADENIGDTDPTLRALALEEDPSIKESWDVTEASNGRDDIVAIAPIPIVHNNTNQNAKDNATQSSAEKSDSISQIPTITDEISLKTSDEFRDELDKAIESGDWAAFEQQTAGILNAPLISSKASNHSASIDSSYDDAENESVESGWSSDDKSVSEESMEIDDERIAELERLIDSDDWQGLVTTARIHADDDSSSTAMENASQFDDMA